MLVSSPMFLIFLYGFLIFVISFHSSVPSCSFPSFFPFSFCFSFSLLFSIPSFLALFPFFLFPFSLFFYSPPTHFHLFSSFFKFLSTHSPLFSSFLDELVLLPLPPLAPSTYLAHCFPHSSSTVFFSFPVPLYQPL